MSIINDALKKVQKTRNKEAKKDETPPSEKAQKEEKQVVNEPIAPAAEKETPKQAVEPNINEVIKPTPIKPPAPPTPEIREKEDKQPKDLSIKVSKEAVIVATCFVISLFLVVAFLRKPKSDSPVGSSASSSRESNFKIKGIVMMPEKSIVLINDSTYEVGEVVNGMKIIEISIDQVKFEKNGKTKIIKVKM